MVLLKQKPHYSEYYFVLLQKSKKVQFGEATLLTQRLKPTFFSDFRALCMCGTRCHDSQWARKLKKSMQKKTLRKQINQFHEIICFDQIPFFAVSKMAKNKALKRFA